RRWDIGTLRTPLVFLSALAVIMGFLILAGHVMVLEVFRIELEGKSDTGYLLLILGLLSAVVLLVSRRKALVETGPYRETLPLAALVIAPFPVIIVIMEPSRFFSYILMVMILSICGSVLYFMRRELLAFRSPSLLFITTGSVLLYSGVALSIRNVDLSNVVWFLSGYHIAFTGMFLLPLGGFLAVEKMSILSKNISTAMLLFLSFGLLFALVIIGETISGGGDLYHLCYSLFLAGTSLGISSYLSEVRNDMRMESARKDVIESMSRATDLESKGRIFYALQQLDRAISANPVDGFGRTREDPNIIFEMEGKKATDEFIFDPREYEISLIEKAKILTSQGKVAEAVKEYMEAMRRRPGYIPIYQNLGMLLSSMPGRKREAGKYFNYLLAYKRVYLDRWIREGMPWDYRFWMTDCLLLYKESIEKKSELLTRLSREGDTWSYYSLVRY
ncbi:MAG: tetratricopeptide repeat protein, partial [Thermoplasmatota archaeon]